MNLTRRPRCSRILLARVRKASSMLMFSLQDTSKKGMSKFSAIFWPLSASTARCAVASHLFAAKTFTTSGDAFCQCKRWVLLMSHNSFSHLAREIILIHTPNRLQKHFLTKSIVICISRDFVLNNILQTTFLI